MTSSHTTLLDIFPGVLRKGRRPLLLLLVICLFCYLVGLIITTRGGIYVLQLIDSYAPSYGLLVVGIAETICISWVYGIQRLFNDIEQMLGHTISKFWMVCWKFIIPALLLAILLFTFLDIKRLSYGDYNYPLYADVLGWIIALTEIGCIPAVAIYKIIKADSKLSIIERIHYLAQPAVDWGPTFEVKRRKEEVDWRVPLKGKKDDGMQSLNMTMETERV